MTKLSTKEAAEYVKLTPIAFYRHKEIGNIEKKDAYTEKELDAFLSKVKIKGSRALAQKNEVKAPKEIKPGELNKKEFADAIGVHNKTIFNYIRDKKIEDKPFYTQKDVDKYKEEHEWRKYAKPELDKASYRALLIIKSDPDHDVSSKIELITVEKAKVILGNNANNRAVNERNLSSLVSDMKSGSWKQTGESIKIAQNGRLLDGQHRLLAIIKTKIPQKMLVTRGLDNDAFKFIDTGRSRKASDVLAIEGLDNPTKLASSVKYIINFERGFYSAAATHSGARNSRITNNEVSKFAGRHKKQLEESLKYGFAKNNKIISGSLLTSFHYIFNKIDVNKADYFCHSLVEGTDLKAGSPIHQLRQKLIMDMGSKYKMRALDKSALICKAWNQFRENKMNVKLIWDSKREQFPKPI